ncbi:hypothetical protein ACVIGB_002038 [Bradyrhizobium sp. USDA 4341]
MSERHARTLPNAETNSATALLDKAAQAMPTHWSPGPGFNLFYARLLAARRIKPLVFVSGPMI